MAEEYQLRNNPPVPKYFQYDQIQKEEFLSQLGNYTQEQRSLFRKLCEFWEPELAFERFLKQEKDGFSFLDSHLRFLMNRLSSSRCGLLQMKVDKGDLVPDRIILTEPDSIRFYYYIIENEYLKILLQEDKSFIGDEYLLEAGITIPSEFVEDLSHTEISNEFLSHQKNNVRILRVTLEGSKPFFCTPYTVQHVIRIARENIRHFLSNSQVITLVAKLMGQMNSEVQRSVGTTDTLFWNKLTSVLLEHREDVLMKRKNYSVNVFQYVSLLYAYTRNALDETERIRQETQQKKDEMIRVCKELYNRKDPFVDQTILNDYLNDGLKRWDDFKELFFDKCVHIKNRTGLPIIVNMGTGYMHRDHLFPVFQTELELASTQLKEYYRLEMEQMLTSRQTGVNCFSSQSIFVNHVQDMVEKNNPVLGALLKKPKLVSEGLILFSKKSMGNQSPDQVRQLLNKYFEEDSTLRFKRLDRMLDLYLIRIYKEAYQKLPLLRRIIMRIFGKHESFSNSFAGNVVFSERRNHSRNNSKSYDPSRVSTEEDVRDSHLTGPTGPSSIPGSTPDSSARRSRRRRSTPEKKTPNYSYRQRTRAWKEFEDLVHRKD